MNGISIITSFGCPFDCWFCIMKQHSLYNYKNCLDYDKINKFLIDNKNADELSISGGGDPLNDFGKNKSFYYDFLFPTVKKIGMNNMEGIDIHTRIPLYDEDFWKHVNRCVFSISFEGDKIVNEHFLRWIYKRNLCKIRLFHCVLPETTDKNIENMLKLADELKCQISVKQLHGFDDKGRFLEIIKKYPALFKVYDKNYLKYYMPNNIVTNTFMF